MTNGDRERARRLMMAALDAEISPDERRQFDALLAASPELQVEWRRLARVKEVTTGMTLQQVPEEIWDGYWTSVYRRTERGIAWVLISLGAIVLAGYWVWHAIGALFADTETPLFIRVAIAAVALGSAILIISVLREKLFVHRRDPYQKEIIR